MNAGRVGRGLEWLVALIVMLSIGLDPSVTIWRANASGVPPEFRTISVSASDAALLILVVYGLLSRRRHPVNEAQLTAPVIAWSGATLIGCLGLSAFAAGVPWLSLARSAEVALGLLACLILAHRPSLATRMLVCGAGIIVLQLPQVAVQEFSQTSRSLGSLIPGWPPVTDARIPGSLVIFGPGNLRWQRGMGSFVHPNVLGGFLALALVLSLPWLARGGRNAVFLWPVWAIAWIELILTFSRGALAATIAGCLLWGSAHYRRPVRDRRVVVLASAPFVAVTGLALLIGNVLVPRLDPAGALRSDALAERWRLIRIAVRVISSHPMLGVGAGNFSLAEAHLPLLDMTVQPVHVVPLLVTAEAGIVAGLAWLALVVGGPVVELYRVRAGKREWCERLAVPVVILVLASLDHYFWTFASGQALFWVTLGAWASRPGSTPSLERREVATQRSA